MEISILFIICILVIVLDWYIAKWFFEAAKAKGFLDKKYFWIAFWLGFVGYLLIVALPDRGNSQLAANDELPDL